MPIRCIQCGDADLGEATVQLPGTIRGENYSVEMPGLECPNCHYRTIEGTVMPEFGRLLADLYRSAHGFLTSEDIRARRKRLAMSQRKFADYVGVGEATIKRAEMGKIQDHHTDEAIRRKTNFVPYAMAAQNWRIQAIVTSTNAGQEAHLLSDVTQQTLGLPATNLPLVRAVPAYLASRFHASTRG
jgi:putative zinc finger/helix-turn-helix YgiT family protein